MNVIIYNINSFGGNYEYIIRLFAAYKQNKNVESCILIMPVNSEFSETGVRNILLTDKPRLSNKILRKFHFVYRSLVNPFRFRSFLKKQPHSFVVFNDFDQVTALVWPYFFKSLKRKHQFAVTLHDPDRDRFFSWKKLSERTMKNIMSLMTIAFYHGFLPHKSYYEGDFEKVIVPQGIYYHETLNASFLDQLKQTSEGSCLIGILGNIRDEKNYKIIIDALPRLENVKLLVAGNPANSGVSTQEYREHAKKQGVENKVIWMERYLDDADFNAAIEACDVVLLYYKDSFTSQSAVLNNIAPYGKKLIVSDTKSSLTEVVREYGLGAIVPNNDVDQLTKAIAEACLLKNGKPGEWSRYMNDMSWEKNVAIAVNSYKKLGHES